MKKWTLALAAFLLGLALLGPNTIAQDAGEPEDLDVFVPTDKLSADSAISFPVDI
jgi:hypothetical protein